MMTFFSSTPRPAEIDGETGARLGWDRPTSVAVVDHDVFTHSLRFVGPNSSSGCLGRTALRTAPV